MKTFIDYKQEIGITDMAISLGYVREVKLGKHPHKGHVYRLATIYKDRSHTDDKIVINNVGLGKEKELYYNENDELGYTDRGDLLDFIKNRIESFPNYHSNTFKNINSILENYSPSTIINNPRLQVEFKSNVKPFNISDWMKMPFLKLDSYYFTKERGISEETLKIFLPFIHKISFKNWKSGNFNYGFPYTKLTDNEILGYELRNYNTKIFTPGSDKSYTTWCALLADNIGLVENVFLFESAIDAMSFYELNKYKYSDFKTSAFFSFGGQMALSQCDEIFKNLPNATYYACFDNDVKGRLYDILVAFHKADVKVGTTKVNDYFSFTIKNKSYSFHKDDFTLSKLQHQCHIKLKFRTHKARFGKDFNEELKKIKLNSYERTK